MYQGYVVMAINQKENSVYPMNLAIGEIDKETADQNYSDYKGQPGCSVSMHKVTITIEPID